MPATYPREFQPDEPLTGSPFRENLNVMRRAIIELQQAARQDTLLTADGDDSAPQMYARVKTVAQDGIYVELERIEGPFSDLNGIPIPDPGETPVFGAFIHYVGNYFSVGEVVKVVDNPGYEPALPDTNPLTREVITPSDPGPPPVAAVFGPPQYVITEIFDTQRKLACTAISAPRTGTLPDEFSTPVRFIDCIRGHVGPQDGTAPPSPDGYFTATVFGSGPLGPGDWLMAEYSGIIGNEEEGLIGAGNHSGNQVPLECGVDKDDACVYGFYATDVIWVRGTATFQSVNRDRDAQETFLNGKSVPSALGPEDGMVINWKIRADGLDTSDPAGVEYEQTDFPAGKFADDSLIPATASVLVALRQAATDAAFCTIYKVLFMYDYVQDAIVDLVDPASIAVEDDPDSTSTPKTKRIRYKKRKVRLNGYNDTDEAFTYLAIGGGGNTGDVRGDEMETQPTELPTPYPPTDGSAVLVGNAGAFIEVWELDDPVVVGKRIRRAYMKPPVTPDPSAEFTTADFTTEDGGDPAGGGAGTCTISPQQVNVDVMGRIVDTEDSDECVLTAGDHIVIGGTDTAPEIKHSKQEETGTEVAPGGVVGAVTGGVSLTIPKVEYDSKGHVIPVDGVNKEVQFIGDEWIDFADGGSDEVQVTHQPAQTDGEKMIEDPVITVTSGAAAGEGSIEIKVADPYVDSKGHVNTGLSSTDSATISAGDRIRLSGSGSDVSVYYVPGDAGSPTSIGNVMVGGTLSWNGSAMVFTPSMAALNVTKNSYGEVTDVALGTPADGTPSTVTFSDC